MSSHEITFNTNLSDTPRTRAGFTYRMGPTLISITDTGLGSHAVTENIKAVLRNIEYWHQGSISKFKIMCRDGQGFWHRVGWDDKTASVSALKETDERKARNKVLSAFEDFSLVAEGRLRWDLKSRNDSSTAGASDCRASLFS